MAATENFTIRVIEIRHKGPTLQFQVGSPTEYITGTVQGVDGEKQFHIQAEKIKDWAAEHEGIEAAVADIKLPKVNLSILFERPGTRETLNLGAVCDTFELWQEAKASGAAGTIFTKEDVRTALEEDECDEYLDLSSEEREQFLDDHWWRFVERIDDRLSERGFDHIRTMISMELDEAIEEFRGSQATASP